MGATLNVAMGTTSTMVESDDDARLTAIENIGLTGRYQLALNELSAVAPLATTASVRARAMYGWLWGHLGGARAARRLHAAEHRRQPSHASAKYYWTYELLRERGPVEAWLEIGEYVPPPGSCPILVSEIWSLKARLLALLGDHRQADACFEACEVELLGAPRWTSVKASLIEARQRRKEARELLESTARGQPPHRVLVSHLASLLEAANEPERALQLLGEADAALEAPIVASQRAALEHELGRFEDELSSLLRFEQLSTRADSQHARELSLRRAENSYRRGDYQGFRAHVKNSGHAYFEQLAQRLPERDQPPERKQLELPVLLQEPMGCAPASLAIVASYFGSRVDHVDVADQICYEGTASHSERGWVEARGWLSREFTVDFATAQALIERGVPFLLVTVDVASAHAQVVVGFDRTRQSLLTRDPMSLHLQELDAPKLFERHRAYGPRGHVLLPPEHAQRLEGLTLPEHELHDLAHALRTALERNDDAAVKRRFQALQERAPGHALTLWAERMLAQRDGDPYAIKACSEALLASFPGDDNAELSVQDCLASIGTDAEREARLMAKLEKPPVAWIYYERLARLLRANAERWPEARRALRRAERRVPTRGQTLALRAELEADSGRPALALRLLRAASTLEPTDDDLARSYFEAAFRSGEPEPALALLRDRVARYAGRSGEPVGVLFDALEWLDREAEAFAVLEHGLERRPDDGALLAFAARVHARYQRAEQASQLLARAHGKVGVITFELTAARLAELRGDLGDALARHEAVLAEQPLLMASQQSAAWLRSQLFGFEKAHQALALSCAAYPTHCGLRELYVTWLRGHDPARVLPELDAMLAQQPAYAWARRERALVLSDLGEHTRALEEAERAAVSAPQHAASHRVLASVLIAAGHREQALPHARRAVELWPDASGCVSELLALAGSLEEQIELLRWTFRVVSEKTLGGEALLEWRSYALNLLPGEELRELCRQLFEKRGSLWVTHLLWARETLLHKQPAEARSILSAAIERFGTVPRLYLDLADVARQDGDESVETQALEAALRLNPAWEACVLRVAASIGRRRDPRLARATLERGLRFNPRSASLLLALARLAAESGEPESALELARRAVSCEPEDESAWETYAHLAERAGRREDVSALAEELARDRPWNARIWLRLAEVEALFSENLASIAALREALQRQPALFEALDGLAEALARIGKRDEALAVCDAKPPSYFLRGALRARRAWVLAQSGELEAACTAMREVLDAHPDQLWGLQQLVTWEADRKRYEESERLARELVKRAPRQAYSYGYLADALLALDDEKGAWDALSRAAQLDPSYAFAGGRRVELALQEGRLADVERVIGEQGPHVAPASRDFWEICLRCAEGDASRAFDVLRRLAGRPGTEPMAITRCVEPLSRLPPRVLKAGLKELVSDGSLEPAIGSLWVSVLVLIGSSPSLWSLLRLRRRHAAAFDQALTRYFEVLGERRASLLRLLLALLLLGRNAKQSDETWSKVGFALTNVRAYVAAELWLSDHRKRKQIEAWSLHNLSVAALENFRPAAAWDAAEHALLLPTDNTLQRHLAFAAFGRAVSGDLAGARELLSGRSERGLTPRYAKLFEAADLLVRLSECSDALDRRLILRGLRRIDFSRASLHMADMVSGGTLVRWLAAGVLRQQFQLVFWLSRWFYPLLIGALVIGFVWAPLPDAREWCGGVLAILAMTFVIWRLKT